MDSAGGDLTTADTFHIGAGAINTVFRDSREETQLYDAGGRPYGSDTGKSDCRFKIAELSGDSTSEMIRQPEPKANKVSQGQSIENEIISPRGRNSFSIN